MPFFGPEGFAFDGTSRLWVVTERTSTDSSEMDVFGRDGAYLTTIRLRYRVKALAFRGDSVAALVERAVSEDEGVRGVDLYREGGD